MGRNYRAATPTINDTKTCFSRQKQNPKVKKSQYENILELQRNERMAQKAQAAENDMRSYLLAVADK